MLAHGQYGRLAESCRLERLIKSTLGRKDQGGLMAVTSLTFCLACLHSLQARPDTVPGARRLRSGLSAPPPPPPPLSPSEPAPPLSLGAVASLLGCRVDESMLLPWPAFDCEELDELCARSREGARLRYADMMMPCCNPLWTLAATKMSSLWEEGQPARTVVALSPPK